jgi:hypothetical protein
VDSMPARPAEITRPAARGPAAAATRRAFHGRKPRAGWCRIQPTRVPEQPARIPRRSVTAGQTGSRTGTVGCAWRVGSRAGAVGWHVWRVGSRAGAVGSRAGTVGSGTWRGRQANPSSRLGYLAGSAGGPERSARVPGGAGSCARTVDTCVWRVDTCDQTVDTRDGTGVSRPSSAAGVIAAPNPSPRRAIVGR